MATFEALKSDAVRGYRERQTAIGTVGSFSTTFIQDFPNRQEPDGEWDRIDAYIKFTSGAPIGVERRITGWSAGNSTLAFSSVPSIPLSGTYRLTKTFNDADQGLAVNSALRDSFPKRVVEGFATAATISDDHRLTVPSAAWGPQADLVLVERSVGTTNSDYNFETLDEGVDYELERSGSIGTLIFAQVAASGMNHRLHFRRSPGELSADTDSTDEPANVIVLGARKFLALAEGDAQAAEGWSQMEAIAKNSWIKNRAPRPMRYPRLFVG